jgi:hypothetical protein
MPTIIHYKWTSAFAFFSLRNQLLKKAANL